MNVHMWQHPATQHNWRILAERGVRRVGPEAGDLACGWQGPGRMAEPDAIAAALEQLLTAPSLRGRRVLVTAGGTQERIDAARVLANRSSGRMGYAVAAEAARRGAEVVLVSGPCALPTPHGVRRVDVSSALEMRDAVLAELPGCDLVVKAAAVADFRPREALERKLRKEDLGPEEGVTLELVRNPDILAEVAHRRVPGQLVVGFAAESHDVVDSARRKLERKGCDLVVANDVSRSDAGFDVDTNAVVLVWPGGESEELPLLSKAEVAAQLLDRLEKRLEVRSG